MKQQILMQLLLMIIILNLSNKANLLENTVAQPAPNAANRILKNVTIAVALKYLSNHSNYHWLIVK